MTTMAVQLFILRGVPDDEAEDIRKLLTDHGIDFYETPAGNWGISMPALWLNNEYQLDRAKSLIDDYQKQRQLRVRAEYNQLKREGKHKRFIDEVKNNPVRVAAFLALAIVIVYFSTKPFIDLAQIQ